MIDGEEAAEPGTRRPGARPMEAHRSRRTRDQARKVWYGYYRQVRFARWMGTIRLDLDPLRAFHGPVSPGWNPSRRDTPDSPVP